MTRVILLTTLVCVALSPMASCSPITEEYRAARKFDVKVTLDDPNNPTRVRFDLYRTPYANDQDQRLSVYEQIRLGMRRFAAEQLLERGLCPYGFSGPDRVGGSADDMQHKFFTVTCLSPLSKPKANQSKPKGSSLAK